MSGAGRRVFIVAGIRLFREGLATALQREFGFSVIGAAASAAAFREADVVLLDAQTPGAGGAIREILAAQPEARVVVLGAYGERAPGWAATGVAGYVPRDAPLEELARVLGEAATSPRMATQILRRVAA